MGIIILKGKVDTSLDSGDGSGYRSGYGYGDGYGYGEEDIVV